MVDIILIPPPCCVFPALYGTGVEEIHYYRNRVKVVFLGPSGFLLLLLYRLNSSFVRVMHLLCFVGSEANEALKH